MTYQTCGEISCEECNDRYEKALARIAELEKERDKYKAADEALTARLKVDDAYTDELERMVRKYVAKCKLYGICSGITDDGYASGLRCSICTKAIALLQPEAGKEVGK